MSGTGSHIKRSRLRNHGIREREYPQLKKFSDFVTFAQTLGANAIISFNGYTDTAASAFNMAEAARASGLNVIDWELCNEPFIYESLFPSPASYLAAMNPYFDQITLSTPGATAGVFFGGSYLWVGKFTNWDSGMSAYTPAYWNGISVHVYPFAAASYSNLSTAEAFLNGVLAHGTTEYIDSTLAPMVGANMPIFISELQSYGGATPFQTYIYNSIFLAEYIARMSTDPSVKAVGIQSLYLGNSTTSGMVRAFNDYEQYLVDNVEANPDWSTNTATDPNTPYQFYMSAPGLAMAVANEAINSSTHIWPATVTGGPTVPIQGYDGKPVPAIYAAAYQGDNGKHYLLITNKSGSSQSVTIQVNGAPYHGSLTLAFVSNSNASVANTAASPNAVSIVTQTTSKNPITIGPYSVTRVEW